jgi:hypothetical protein
MLEQINRYHSSVEDEVRTPDTIRITPRTLSVHTLHAHPQERRAAQSLRPRRRMSSLRTAKFLTDVIRPQVVRTRRRIQSACNVTQAYLWSTTKRCSFRKLAVHRRHPYPSREIPLFVGKPALWVSCGGSKRAS